VAERSIAWLAGTADVAALNLRRLLALGVRLENGGRSIRRRRSSGLTRRDDTYDAKRHPA